MTTHDERLGRALRGLDVPNHGPDFYSRLAERLDQDRPTAGPDATVPAGSAHRCSSASAPSRQPSSP